MFEQLRAPFPRDAIQWRAQTVTRDGTKALALAYIDARAVMNRLDEIVGPANWQDEYDCVNGRTICKLGINVDGVWVWKSDGAGDTQVEAEKGGISDAFKRAAVKWGIGRYLYDFDTPWVPCETREHNGRKQWTKWKADPWAFVKGAPTPQQQSAPTGRAASDTAMRMKEAINKAENYEALQALVSTDRWKDGLSKLTPAEQSDLRDIYKRRTHSLSESPFGERAA